MADTDAPTAAELLGVLRRLVVGGRRLEPDTIAEVDGETFGLVAVHPSRIKAGMCGMWFRVHRTHPGSTDLRVLQVQLPDEYFCACHAGSQPRLDLPGGEPGRPLRERRRQRRECERIKRRGAA